MRSLLRCSPLRMATFLLLLQERDISVVADDSLKQNPKDCNLSSALEQALNLKPPKAISVKGGDTEGSEWWLEHQDLLRLAWNEWDEHEENELPFLDSNFIDPKLRSAMEQTKESPTLEHEASAHENWEMVHSTENEDKSSKTPDFSADNDSESNDKYAHRVYRYKNFLTLDGIQKLRGHLDALSKNAIPKRRPNAMNRNGLLLDPTVPGGVSGDLQLQNFVELLASEYLRPLGRSFYPEYAGNAQDDAKHYAFTIQYGTDDEEATPKSVNATTDLDLKEHMDASIYTLNINLNLPNEDYSGSSLYFVSSQEKDGTKRLLSEVTFEPGTAILHRGMTKHGAKPLERGKRNNLVIWLHGIDGYVRVAPYQEEQRLSLQERWSLQQQQKAAEAKSRFLREL